MYDIVKLNEKLVAELREIAKALLITNAEGLKKQDLIYKILDQQAIDPKLTAEVYKAELEKDQERAKAQAASMPEIPVQESIPVSDSTSTITTPSVSHESKQEGAPRVRRRISPGVLQETTASENLASNVISQPSPVAPIERPLKKETK